MLKNREDDEIYVRTCREYHSAVMQGYEPTNTYAIKTSVWFKEIGGLLLALEGAAAPQRSYISNPKVGVTNLDLIPFSLMPDLSGDRPELGETFQEIVDKGIMIVEEAHPNLLRVEETGMGQQLREVARADFNNDGIEDILLFEYHAVTQGTLGYGGVVVLTRRSRDGKFEVIPPPPNTQITFSDPYWFD